MLSFLMNIKPLDLLKCSQMGPLWNLYTRYAKVETSIENDVGLIGPLNGSEAEVVWCTMYMLD